MTPCWQKLSRQGGMLMIKRGTTGLSSDYASTWQSGISYWPGEDSLWDEEKGCYCDLLRLPDGRASHLKVRSMVRLIPLCATVVFEKYEREAAPEVARQAQERIRRRPELLNFMHPTGEGHRRAGRAHWLW